MVTRRAKEMEEFELGKKGRAKSAEKEKESEREQ